MSKCPHCTVFSGTPTCISCRTYFRIGAILQGGGLAVYSEQQVISALRNCAGSLADLAEGAVAGPFGPGSTPPSGTKSPETGRWPIEPSEDKALKGSKEAKEEQPKNESGKSSSHGVAKDTKRVEKEESSPKESRRKAKRRDKPKEGKKKRTATRSEKSPGREGRSRVKLSEKASGSKEGPGEAVRKEKREVLRDDEPDEERDRSEESIPEEVEEGLGLSRIPARGTVGKRWEEQGIIPRGSRAPPEPPGPPPGRRKSYDDEEERRPKSRSRSREKGPRWRGFKHYSRGVDHWKHVKHQQWLQRQKQKPREAPGRWRK